uniref:Uncharacterized protein n=1 Tax=Sinorhizobium sp. M14 TaxID=430451 RepID=A0A142BPB1_9HYPH|nr:hypothetical protein [Sinorhizobium sp. M14]AMP34919.1 hypothetical protein pSinB_053 [Sinorhizobium sp. M14]
MDSIIGDVVPREDFEDTNDRAAFVGASQGAIVALDAVASGRRQVGAAGFVRRAPAAAAS